MDKPQVSSSGPLRNFHENKAPCPRMPWKTKLLCSEPSLCCTEKTFMKTKQHIPACPALLRTISIFLWTTHISSPQSYARAVHHGIHYNTQSGGKDWVLHICFFKYSTPFPAPQSSKIKIQRKERILAKCLSPEHNQMMTERSDGYVFSFAFRWRDTSPLGGLEWPLAGLLFTNSVSSSLEKSDSDIITLLFWILPERKGTRKHFSFTWNKS